MPADSDPRSETSLADVIFGSVVISAASLGFMYAGQIAPEFQSSFAFTWMASGLLAAGWLALFLYAVARFGKRGLWVLLGAGPALWVIFILLALPLACAFRHDCL